MEEWKAVKGYEGLYEVSNAGRVRSTKTSVILKLLVLPNEYLQVSLYKDKQRRQMLVHRLVATAFIENGGDLPMINHKDENKQNNAACNLEWCDCRYNNSYGAVSPLEKMHQALRKSVAQYSMDGTCIATYDSIRAAARATGCMQSSISCCCNGQRGYKSTGGYIWKFV